MTVFAYVLHHLFGNLFKSVYSPGVEPIFNTLPQKPNKHLISTSESQCGFGPLGKISISFPFWGLGGFFAYFHFSQVRWSHSWRPDWILHKKSLEFFCFLGAKNGKRLAKKGPKSLAIGCNWRIGKNWKIFGDL